MSMKSYYLMELGGILLGITLLAALPHLNAALILPILTYSGVGIVAACTYFSKNAKGPRAKMAAAQIYIDRVIAVSIAVLIGLLVVAFRQHGGAADFYVYSTLGMVVLLIGRAFNYRRHGMHEESSHTWHLLRRALKQGAFFNLFIVGVSLTLWAIQFLGRWMSTNFPSKVTPTTIPTTRACLGVGAVIIAILWVWQLCDLQFPSRGPSLGSQEDV